MFSLPSHYLPINNQLKNKSDTEIATLLHQRVQYQSHAIEASSRVLETLVYTRPNESTAGNCGVELHTPQCLTFAGPPGTGKTELSESIATLLGVFGTPAYVTGSGNYLAEASDVAQITGPAPGLVGYDADTMYKRLKHAAEYARCVKECIPVLFIDEIHKAHRDVQNALRDFVCYGKLSSKITGGNIRFPRPILCILAANWGSKNVIDYCNNKHSLQEPINSSTMQQRVIDDMAGPEFKMDPATIGRYGTIIAFEPFTIQRASDILEKYLKKLLQPYNVNSDTLSNVTEHVIKSYTPIQGIRPQIRIIDDLWKSFRTKLNKYLNETKVDNPELHINWGFEGPKYCFCLVHKSNVIAQWDAPNVIIYSYIQLFYMLESFYVQVFILVFVCCIGHHPQSSQIKTIGRRP
jgi:ATP-dependent Clp protease ATP-binding subunit ClpA